MPSHNKHGRLVGPYLPSGFSQMPYVRSLYRKWLRKRAKRRARAKR